MGADVLRRQFLVVGESRVFHPHDYSRNPILLAPTSVPLRSHGYRCPGFLPHELNCSSIDALLRVLSALLILSGVAATVALCDSTVIARPERR